MRYVVLLLMLLSGCSGVGVRPVAQPVRVASGDSTPTVGRVSLRTEQVLRRYDLIHLHPQRLDMLSERLLAEAKREPLPELLAALAEVEFLLAERERTAERYTRAAGYAYHYLFRTVREPGEDYDPQFRVICELYNASVAHLLLSRRNGEGFIPLRQTDETGQSILPVRFQGFDYRPDEFGPVQLCSAYRVVGLANRHRTYGLGVPLIGTRDPAAACPEHGFHPVGLSFPMTAFLDFEGGLEAVADPQARRLELINPLTIARLRVRQRTVPLETDLTTPLAYCLGQTDLERLGLVAFLRPDSLGNHIGLHALQPYRPGKIPLVFVHGLLSSPATWAPMYNDLLADPVLRERYQFWVYFYPTGHPYLLSAAKLRNQLESVRRRLDPDGSDPALNEMVFVGHSMGGLITRLLTTDSGDDFWHLVSPDPLDSLKLSPGSRASLRNTFYFQRQPYITRAVFIGTPHRGSRLSPSPLGRLATRLAGMPQQLLGTMRDLIENNSDINDALRQQILPTSVDLLAPEAPALQLLAHRPRPEGVKYHSIIGVSSRDTLLLSRLFGGGFWRQSDGVVPLNSARLADADSELIVPADHFTVHQHPLAILEVRRILLEHLRETEQRVQPIRRVRYPEATPLAR
ncbi:MAG: alpha/beta hydrolase [Gemmataceae bacterium]